MTANVSKMAHVDALSVQIRREVFADQFNWYHFVFGKRQGQAAVFADLIVLLLLLWCRDGAFAAHGHVVSLIFSPEDHGIQVD